MERQPWNVKGYPMVLKLWPPGLSWLEIDLKMCPIWVQIHGVPMDRSTELSTKFISQAIGPVLEIEGWAGKKI